MEEVDELTAPVTAIDVIAEVSPAPRVAVECHSTSAAMEPSEGMRGR